jgi:hypothetical protein
MAAFGDQYVQRFIERFVFLRFGSSHVFLSSVLTLHTNFLTGSLPPTGLTGVVHVEITALINGSLRTSEYPFPLT